MKKQLLSIFAALTVGSVIAQPSADWSISQNAAFTNTSVGIRFLDAVDQTVITTGIQGPLMVVIHLLPEPYFQIQALMYFQTWKVSMRIQHGFVRLKKLFRVKVHFTAQQMAVLPGLT